MDAEPHRHWDVRLAVALIAIAVLVLLVFAVVVIADLESVRRQLGDVAWCTVWPAG
jgi:uncharacterized protein YoxC